MPGFALPSVVLFEVPVQSLSVLCAFQGVCEGGSEMAWLPETFRKDGAQVWCLLDQPDDETEE